jgi:hypothetical protein
MYRHYRRLAMVALVCLLAISAVVPTFAQQGLPPPIVEALARLGVTDPNLLANLGQAIGNPQALGQALSAANLDPLVVRRELRNLDESTYLGMTQFLGMTSTEQVNQFYQSFDQAAVTRDLTRNGLSTETLQQIYNASPDERAALLEQYGMSASAFASVLSSVSKTSVGATLGITESDMQQFVRENLSQAEQLAFAGVTPSDAAALLALDPTAANFDAELSRLGNMTRRGFVDMVRTLQDSEFMQNALAQAGIDPEAFAARVDALAAYNGLTERPGAEVAGTNQPIGEVDPSIQIAAPAAVPCACTPADPAVVAQLPPALQAALPLFGSATQELLQGLMQAQGNPEALQQLMLAGNVIPHNLRTGLASLPPDALAGVLQFAGLSQDQLGGFLQTFENNSFTRDLAKFSPDLTLEQFQSMLNASPEQRAELLQQYNMSPVTFSQFLNVMSDSSVGQSLGITREDVRAFNEENLTDAQRIDTWRLQPGTVQQLAQIDPASPDFNSQLSALGLNAETYARVMGDLANTEQFAAAAERAGLSVDDLMNRANMVQEQVNGALNPDLYISGGAAGMNEADDSSENTNESDESGSTEANTEAEAPAEEAAPLEEPAPVEAAPVEEAPPADDGGGDGGGEGGE